MTPITLGVAFGLMLITVIGLVLVAFYRER